MTTFVSARGFRFGTESDDLGASYYHGALRRIRDKEVSMSLRNNERFEALRLIQQLVGYLNPQADSPVENWFKVTIKDMVQREGHLSFLVDTLRFISQGQRRLPTAGYQALIPFQSVSSEVTAPRNVSISHDNDKHYSEHLLNQADSFLKEISGNVLYTWVNQDGGFIDLLDTFIFMLRPEGES